MRHIKNLIVLTSLFVATVPAQAQEPDLTVVYAGHVLDSSSTRMLGPKTLLIRDGRILRVVGGHYEPRDSSANVIDLSDKYVLPGLIDTHTHITSETTKDDALRLVTISDSAETIDGVVFARRTLLAGFTTVRNLGGRAEPILALRDAIAAGKVEGPRIVASAGIISAPGGHGDIDGYREDIIFPHQNNICTGPVECRRATQLLVKSGADVIKVAATGGVLSEVATGTGQQLSDDELQAIVETAHALGRKVAAHAHGAIGINAALRAGVNSIEHGTYIDEEGLRLMKSSGAYFVPTLLAGKTIVELAAIDGFFPDIVAKKARVVGPQMQGALTRAYRAGVKIAFGTDSGVSHHGDNAEEFGLMVAAGMSEQDAIVSATINAADLLGMSDDIGSLEEGKFADIIALASNPLDDIDALSNVVFVMKEGVVVKGNTGCIPQ